MHILLALLAVAGVVGIILWRLHMAAEAARGLTQAAEEAHGLFRRWKWRRKLAKDPLDLIQDRREAAVAMMVAIAQSDGAVTERERRTILAEVVQRFGATGQQAEEFLAHGRWIVRDVRDVDRCLQKLAPMIQRTCTAEQVHELLEMLDRVAAAEAPPGTIESQALAKFRRALT